MTDQPRAPRRQTISRDIEVAAIIRRSVRERGFPPSRPEIAKALGLKSQAPVDRALRRMVEQGVIEVAPGVSRGIRIKGANTKAITEDL